MTTHAAETIAAAAQLDHEWDEKALDWPLTSESVVVEVGGYKGRWALQVAERYQPRLYVFEPQGWAALVCAEVLGGAVWVMNYGLGVANQVLPMEHEGTDGCTFVTTGLRAHFGELREIGTAFAELNITHIDLMLMNIEGYEYTLLPHMLDRGILPQRLMVQMHSFAGDSDALRSQLAEHYRLLWDYGDVLTAWERGK